MQHLNKEDKDYLKKADLLAPGKKGKFQNGF